MNTLHKRIYSLVIAISLMAVSALTGCLPTSGKQDATTAAPYAGNQLNGEGSDSQLTETRQKFDQFTEQLFIEEISQNKLDFHFLIKDPEALGYTVPERPFGSVSLTDAQQIIVDLKDVKKQLESFDIRLLSEEQKLTYRILNNHVDTQLMADGLELYGQPLAPTIGVQAQLPILLAEYEFRKKQDVDDYLQIIAGVKDYFGEFLVYGQEQADANLFMSDATIDRVIQSCESYLLVPGNNFMIDTFSERLNRLEGITEEEKSAYLQQHAALLESHFVPAYQALIDGLTALKGTSTYQGGLSSLPKGKEYYEYLVYSATGTSYDSMEELLAAMELLIEDNLKIITTLTKDHPSLLEELDTYAFRQTDPDAILEEIKTMASKDFPPLPKCNYTLKDVPKALELSLSPAFYLTPPIDDYRNNTIYINNNPRFQETSRYTTLAHEGYPGHLYQSVYFRNQASCNLRQILGPTGYSEGWATYVEYYSYTLDNGLSKEMGQLLSANDIATLGLQACIDIYINYFGWTKEQVAEYLGNYNNADPATVEEIYLTMLENPSNYVTYYVGYLEIHNMLKIAREELGRKFVLKDFHEFLLNIGPAPFDVIQPYFTSWVIEQKL